MNEIAVGCRFGVATIFLLAGVAKLARRAEFADAVRNYRLLPERLGVLMGHLIPPVELGIGVVLFAGLGVAVVAAIAGASLVAFTIAVAINLLRGRRIECGCFGVAESRLTWTTVVRNICLTVAAVFVVWRPAASASISTSAAVALLIVATSVVFAGSLVQEALQVRRLTRSLPGGRS